MTMWGVNATNLSLIMSIYASYYTNPSQNIINYKAIANLSSNIAEVINGLATLLAWLLIVP